MYAKRNALMADTSNVPSGLSPEDARLYSMLKSGDDKLIKSVAKQLHRSPKMDPMLFEAANEVLLDGYNKNTLDVDHIDTMSWVCKALGASGNSAYKATLTKVLSSTGSATLQRHCRHAQGMLR
jgi:hypothetical protein